MPQTMTMHSDVADTTTRPAIRKIAVADLRDVLRQGWDDFLAIPTPLIFLCLLYPMIGLVAARAAEGNDLVPLLFPLVAGMALLGPVLAVGVYELSRRRELGLPVSWLNAFDVLRSPALDSIVLVGCMLLAVFVAWLLAARMIYGLTLGSAPPASVGEFARRVFGTPGGLDLALLGNAVGAVFSIVVLTLTVVSVPMLLDRQVPVGLAIKTSIRAVLANPAAMLVWGVLVAAILVLGCLPLFIGLAVAMPVLGHATWHLYRRVVA